MLKNHFKTILVLTNPQFPMAQWDLLLDQACLTLNLLRAARCNPKISAYTYLYGNFNFSATPLDPPGTNIVAYSKPSVRTRWDANGEVGWCIRPAKEHYRCVNVFFSLTRTVHAVDTVNFSNHI